ncbi:MAG TPA: phytanoyl-CoA dioxygenase family protein [Tepidisphaeraceae bacterium]|jgi:hypothetical protein
MLTDQQLKQYHDDGFLILPKFFAREELQPVMNWVDTLVDDLANRLFKAGKIKDKHERAGFYERLTLLDRDFPGAAVLIHINGVLGEPLANLWSTSRLLDIIQQILGPDIAGHPVWNLRAKTPINPLATVPWHQDTAYLIPGAENTFQPTAWIPLIDANAVNGTLQVLKGGHRSGKVFKHSLENKKGHKSSWYLYIEEKDLPKGEIVTCEMPMGSVLLLNQLIPHRSTENQSQQIRWSVDLRWQRPAEPSGMEGVKSVIPMRLGGDKNFKPDWSEWAKKQRIQEYMQEKAIEMKDEFNAMVSGPWMERWEAAPAEGNSASTRP